jgi:hypothetical protein
MPELVNPRHERACQLRASGKTQLDAYNQAFEVSENANGNNSSRFFKRSEIRARVDEIKRRRAVMADIDEVFVLEQLKSIARNGIAVGETIAQALMNGDVSAMQRLRSAAAIVQANELIGRYLGLWRDRGPADALGAAGKTVVEVFWKGSPQEVPATNGDGRALGEQP